MTRGQRAAHRFVWLALAPVLVLLVVYTLLTRADAWAPSTQAAPHAEAGR